MTLQETVANFEELFSNEKGYWKWNFDGQGYKYGKHCNGHEFYVEFYGDEDISCLAWQSDEGSIQFYRLIDLRTTSFSQIAALVNKLKIMFYTDI